MRRCRKSGGTTAIGNGRTININAATQKVKEMALSKRLGGSANGIMRVATKVVGTVAKTAVVAPVALTGAVIQAAQGKEISDIAAGAYAGAQVGKGIAKIAKKPIKGVSNSFKGAKLKRDISKGKYDNELGIDNSVKNKAEKDLQNAVRAALAKQASVATRKGAKIGEYKFWTTLDEELHK